MTISSFYHNYQHIKTTKYRCLTLLRNMQVFNIYEPQDEIFNNVVCVISKASDQPALTCSLIRAFASRLNIL